MPRLRRHHKILVLAACVLVASLVAAPAGQAAKRSVPRGFFGTNTDIGLFRATSEQTLQAQGRLMARSGVESVRAVFNWFDSQPYANALQVPPAQAAQFVSGPGGVPTSFVETDKVVRFAAQVGVRLLPMVVRTPRWASSRPDSGFYYTYMPQNSETFANYMRALIGRYGPNGTFWTANPGVPKVPIREWQIYNEPTRLGGVELQNQLAASTYIPLLRAAHRAIHQADRGAKVVTAGLHNISWQTLGLFYRHGLKGAFDVAAIHVYTRNVSRILEILRLNRQVMQRYHDPKPMWVTEITYSSAQGRLGGGRYLGIERTEAGQARMLRATYRALVRNRRALNLKRAYWFLWSSKDTGPSSFDYAGLLRTQAGVFTPKPALAAYTSTARRFEGCRKSDDARRCAGR